ncbi:MAG TPA: DeoR family transcriptional regulator, partial [Roseiarcus sp.]|nr:DeoR family transcriptional regulator [Roseiarcus sp.]
MRERQRVEIVRDLLAAQGFLSIGDLMAATGVSAASARRDAGRLAAAGYGERVYGGIQRVGGASSQRMSQGWLETPAFDISRAINVDAKRAIARRALEMCVEG